METEEQKITRIHKNYTRWLCGYMKNTSFTTSKELNKYGKDMFGSMFKGVYAIDLIPHFDTKGYFIFNLDTHDKEGIHWVACYYNGKGRYYIYDSFGRRSSKIAPIFIREIKALHKKYTDADYDAEQRDNQVICGQNCLAFLKMVDYYGIKKALLI
jgi:hypothetical protein